MALCGLIARFTRDGEQIDRVFRQSELYRGKWDEYRGGNTYGEMTIEKALSNASVYWSSSAEDHLPITVVENANPEPVPAWSKSSVLELNIDPLPPLLKEYLERLSGETDADRSMLLSSLLGCVASFIKLKRFIPKAQNGEKGYFQNLYPNLWMLSIAPSGFFKTTALNAGAELSIRNDSTIADQMKSQGQKRELRKRLTLLSNLHTTEALLENLAEGVGGLIRCSEFGTWFSSLERNYNAGLQDLFLELYDVPELFTRSTLRGGSLSVRHPFISIAGVTTPSWIREKITQSQNSSGFLARFLIFYPQTNSKIPGALPTVFAPGASPNAKDRLFQSLENINNGEPKKLYLSNHAEKQFERYHADLYHGFNDSNEKTQEIITPFLKRWSPYLLKLSMIMQVFIDPDAQEICTEALDGAKAIMDFVVPSTRLLLENEIGESPHQRKQRRMLEYLDKKGGKIDWRKLQQSKILDGGVKEYEYLVESMESAGLIYVQRNGKAITEILMVKAES
jgi:hypothetical protein